jgi:predicted MFS family arabinose efflux permease
MSSVQPSATAELEDVPRAQPSTRYRNYVLALLLIVGICSWVDRQVFAMLMQAIKVEFNFSDTQLGLLGGVAFGMFYATVGLPLARLADRYNRRNILTACLLLWSAMTVLGGFAVGFASLFLARVGVGVGEAGGSPPSQSIISDYFPPEKRAFALGVFFSFIPLGTLVGLFVSGWLNQYFGWRATFIAVGVPGLLLAGLLRFTLREPVRGASDSKVHAPVAHSSSFDALRYLLGRSSVRHLCAAGALHGIGAFGAAVWLPTYFMRTHGLSSGETGTWLALIAGGAGAVGAWYGGYFSDRLVLRTSDPRWYPRLACLFVLGTLPFLTGVYLTHDSTIALMLFVAPSILQNMFLGAVTATMQNLAGVRRRATIAAFYLFLVNLISMGMGPTLVGMLSDRFSGQFGGDALRFALLGTILISSLWAAAHFWRASRTLREDLALADQPEVAPLENAAAAMR